MKKYLVIFLLALNATIVTAQLDEYYYFEDYYNKTVYAEKKVKTCKIYEERISDSIPTKIIVSEQRFDVEGKLCYNRVYYKADTLVGRLLTYYYDSLDRVTDTYCTWIESKETDRYVYTYNENGLLAKRVMHTLSEPYPKYKKIKTNKLYYDKLGTLLYIKSKPVTKSTVRQKNKTYYQYKNDTTLVKNTKEDEYSTYVNGLLIERFAGLVYTYEYDSLKRLVKYTKNGPWNVIQYKEYTYENGLLVSSFDVENRYDGVVKRRRSYVYEYYR